MIAGYLFVFNNYLPIFICLGLAIIATVISFLFKDVYEVKEYHKESIKPIELLKQYNRDLRVSFKFILRSNRMKALTLFAIVFYSTLKIIDVYRSDLLVEIGVPEEQFSMIFAMLTLIGGFAVTLKKPIEKRFKNRTLSFISLMYIGACLIVGFTTTLLYGKQIIIPIVLMMYAMQKVSTSIWWVLESKYIKSFTKENTRGKITFAYEFIQCVAASIFSTLAGFLLKVVTIEKSFVIIGLVSFVCMLYVLEYMRTRFGLKPKEYTKQDLEFEPLESNETH